MHDWTSAVMESPGLPDEVGPWPEEPAMVCRTCGPIVAFPGLWDGSNKVWGKAGFIVADPEPGIGKEDAQRHAESCGAPGCLAQAVRHVMLS